MICFFWSAKSTSQQVALKLHKTAENSAAKPEKSLCEQPSCPKHAELGKSATRFKTSLRLTAAEQTKAHISSSHWVAATSDDAGKVFIQAVELRECCWHYVFAVVRDGVLGGCIHGDLPHVCPN